jgi:cyclopropane-fatty-acyl-phospholipid synthase
MFWKHGVGKSRGDDMTILTSTKGEKVLPRYFGPAFEAISRIQRGRLDFRLPDGRIFRAEGREPGPATLIEVHNPDIFARLIREGDLGFCEGYVEGWWSTPDLLGFMDLIQTGNNAVYDAFPGMGLVRAYERLRFWLRSNSKTQAKRNISYHYDLGNAFYGLWLDESMTYSSALFRTGQESLEKAQEQKYASMVDQMGAQPGDHVLEIGCGWGGFAEYAAAKRGLKVTCLTISAEQHRYAVARIAKAGLSDRVEIKLQDYRDETGVYDGVASIEMFEAVGEKYWPTYFNSVLNRLRPGKNATLQIITIADHRFETYRKSVDFIQKYIFPGGMLPSPSALRREIERAGMRVLGSIQFGKSYSQTVRRWHEVFNDRWSEVARLGFDDRFRRMWNFYLTSCAGAFEGGNCDVMQITIARPA